MIEIVYRGATEIFDGNIILIRGEQSDQECAGKHFLFIKNMKVTLISLSGTPPVERLLLAPTTEESEIAKKSLNTEVNYQQYVVKMTRNKLAGKLQKNVYSLPPTESAVILSLITLQG